MRCPKCECPLDHAAVAGGSVVSCRLCQREVTVRVFPAAGRGIESLGAAEPVIEGGASCFNCPDRAAVSVCEDCGSYLCAGCQADWFGRLLCLNCIHARREVRQDPDFRPHATIHDNVALMIMLIPLVVIPFYGIFLAMLIAPVSLFLVIRHRKSPRGIVPRGPARLIMAGVLSVLLMAGAAALIGLAVYGISQINRQATAIRTIDAIGETDGETDGE
jgi:hypothetical protein